MLGTQLLLTTALAFRWLGVLATRQNPSGRLASILASNFGADDRRMIPPEETREREFSRRANVCLQRSHLQIPQDISVASADRCGQRLT